MNHVHLCLSDLLDQDLTAYEYFNTLSPALQKVLYEQEIFTFNELQDCANRLKDTIHSGTV